MITIGNDYNTVGNDIYIIPIFMLLPVVNLDRSNNALVFYTVFS